MNTIWSTYVQSIDETLAMAHRIREFIERA